MAENENERRVGDVFHDDAIHEWIEGEPGDQSLEPEVLDFLTEELAEAIPWTEQREFPVPDSRLSVAELNEYREQGLRLRIIPKFEVSPELPDFFGEVLEENRRDAGWYFTLADPPPAGEFSRGTVSVYDAFLQAEEIGRSLPPSDYAPRLPTALELIYLTGRDPEALGGMELLARNAPRLSGAVSISLVEGNQAGQKRYALNDPFEGAVLPIRRIV